MAIPTPSFFKIRLVAFLIGFVVVCFLVGVAKDVFGAVTYEIVARGPNTSEFFSIMPPQNVAISYAMPNPITFPIHYQTEVRPVSDYYLVSYTTYYLCGFNSVTDEKFKLKTYANNSYVTPVLHSIILAFPQTSESAWSELTDEEACNIERCKDEKEAKRQECGGDELVDWSTWSDETCSGGTCINPCDDEGEYTAQDCYDTCSGDIESYDSNECSCICGNCDEELAEKQAECGSWGVDHTTWNNVTCTGECNDDPCDEPVEACINKCGGQENIDNFSCKDGVVTVPCECKEPPEESEPGQPEPDPTPAPPDQEPEPDQPDNPDDPSDEKLGAIHDELQKIVEQNNDRKDQLNTATNKLDWIGKNSEIIADNTDAINKNISNLRSDIASGVEAGVSDAMEGVADGLKGLEKELGKINTDIDQLTNQVKDINEGTYNAPVAEEKYTSEEHDFGLRTSEFLNQMKTTGIFALPTKLSDSIPGGGSSTYTISTGDTFGGNHTIDFDYLAGALAILKYIFQIAGMALAIRIVTLKR